MISSLFNSVLKRFLLCISSSHCFLFLFNLIFHISTCIHLMLEICFTCQLMHLCVTCTHVIKKTSFSASIKTKMLVNRIQLVCSLFNNNQTNTKTLKPAAEANRYVVRIFINNSFDFFYASYISTSLMINIKLGSLQQ